MNRQLRHTRRALATALAAALLGGCGGQAEDAVAPSFSAGLRVSAPAPSDHALQASRVLSTAGTTARADGRRRAAALPVAASPAGAGLPTYDMASGVLELPALAVASGAVMGCHAVQLRTIGTAPVQLELAAATPVACTGNGPDATGGRYDADSGLLTLGGLAVLRIGGTDCYDVALRRSADAPIRLTLQSAQPAGCAGGDTTAGSFRGNVVLGSPTDRSIRANVFAPDQSGRVWLAYGTQPGVYPHQTAPQALRAGQPLEITLDGLAPATAYRYRLYFEPAGSGSAGASDEYRFRTARAPGEGFTFALQGDSHPERERSQFDAGLYSRTLLTAAADEPDFYIAMGDDFSVDTLDPKTVTQAQVVGRYTLQRPWLGLIGRTAPVYLVNGNHEQAARYLLDGTPDNVAVWAQNARNAHYAQPAPDAFYSGNAEQVPHIGLLRNHYAWHWGDALFVVIDPYWASPVAVDAPFDGSTKRSNLWTVTHGDAQYQWLKTTLEWSRARFKFVFAHHVMGTGRGGIELAGLYEWGGANTSGSWGLGTQRPSWPQPIHQLMAAHKVSVFFQGHDHIWVRQQLDGVTYQTLSEPADPNYALYNADAFRSGDRLPNTGYTRVRVEPDSVRVEYVRTWLPKDEGPGKVSGAVAFGYTLP
jgi:hypothetical protein